MRTEYAKDTVVQKFKASIKAHVRNAQIMGMTPSELVLQLAGHEADMDFIYSWEDAEKEVACSWLRLLEKQVH
jgi:hypothetical protein